MAKFIPLTFLKDTASIVEFCQECGEPVFIIRNGSPEMVIMDSEFIEELKHNAGVTSAHYSSDGELIVTSSFDGTAKIWNANTYECLQTIPNIPGLFVQGVDFRNLAPGSNFTEEDKRILRMYGALID